MTFSEVKCVLVEFSELKGVLVEDLFYLFGHRPGAEDDARGDVITTGGEETVNYEGGRSRRETGGGE